MKIRCQFCHEPLFCSLELKLMWAFLLSVVRLSASPSVRKLFAFLSSLELLGQFQPNLAQSILAWRGFKIFQMKGYACFHGYRNSAKIHWRNWKISFSRTTGPISSKQDTKHPLVRGTQGFSKKDQLFIKKEIIWFSPLQFNVMV